MKVTTDLKLQPRLGFLAFGSQLMMVNTNDHVETISTTQTTTVIFMKLLESVRGYYNYDHVYVIHGSNLDVKDLSLLDCELCYAEESTAIPQCYPYNSGRIYLGGCFMRYENYSFFKEYTRPTDRAVFGNTTRKNPTFKESVKEALNRAIVAAPHQKGHATDQEAVLGAVNESVYVPADCWMTLNASSCRACLENASASILECLPQSEGQALKNGCFMRYSDKDFLNKELGTRSSRVILVSFLAVVVVGIAVGLHIWIWRHRKLQRHRRVKKSFFGKKVAVIDSFCKYSTLEKAKGAFDNANKLGQGGFGTIYKGILPDGREVAVKRLLFNKRQRALDFYNEINIISSAEHKNLVRLLGCGCSGPESLLVYELLPNKRTVEQLYDPNLMLHNQHNNNVKNKISREVHIGLLCTQEIQSLRPTMSKALQMLTKEEQLPAPTNPTFIDERTILNKCEDTFYSQKVGISTSIATISNSSFHPR
ncbi:hypothetical protein SO802_011835 [Lithocarpus litseifolius]|uniref:Cysteine-rich receptor-like protein kinase 2 n=1 Tax=Lithocarpus litseifolius TaxID=425828 RepID=A0AAW2D1U8_9ROSI